MHPSFVVHGKNREEAYSKVEDKLGYPCFVKPANLGSSVGINKCKIVKNLRMHL